MNRESRTAPEAKTAAGRAVPPAARKPRQDNIDLLRAVAIVAVMAYHFTSRFQPEFYDTDRIPFVFPYGNLGVDLFFVVSGYCIFMTLDSSRSLENFWARRVARIQPAYMVAIVVTFVVVWIGDLPGRETSPAIALSNMLWLNVIPDWPMVDSAYWSLVVELKFYLLIGIIYYLMAGRNISLAWLGLAVAGAALEQAGGALAAVGTGIFLAPYAPFFLAGLLAWEWDRLRRSTALLLAGVCAILLMLSARVDEVPWVGLLIGVYGFAVLRMPWLKVPRPITFIGLISYSLYLLHQNIGYVLIRALPGSIELRLAAVFGILIALAALSYWAVERRWERAAQRLAERALGLGRRSLRLPSRRIRHPTLEEEMRAW